MLRGGYGIYYNQGALATSEGLYFNPPYFNLSVYFPAPRPAAADARRSVPGVVPRLHPAVGDRVPARSADAVDGALERQRAAAVSATARAIEVAYVGSRGHDLISARDVNQAAGQPGAAQPAAEPAVRRHHADRIARLVAVQRAAGEVSSSASTRGLSLLLAYTLGKSTDDASGFFTSAGDPNFPQNSLDPGAEQGRSSFDVRHRFSASFAYALPLGGNVLAARHRRCRAIVTHPERPAVHGRAAPGHRQQQHRPVEPRVRLQRSPERDRRSVARQRRPPTQWFNTAAFSLPAFGTFGNAGRNILDGPGYKNVNLALIKTSRSARHARLQLRAEAFNLLNRTNLDLPDAFLGSPTFGQVLSAGSPRRIQFGVRAVF